MSTSAQLLILLRVKTGRLALVLLSHLGQVVHAKQQHYFFDGRALGSASAQLSGSFLSITARLNCAASSGSFSWYS